MDLNNLRNNYHQLINQMEKDNYDISSIDLIKNAINFIFSKPEDSWHSYDEIRTAYTNFENISNSYRAARNTAINKIMAFDQYEITPNNLPCREVLKKGAYYKLNEEFRLLIDEYSKVLDLETIAPKSKETYLYGAASVLYSFNQLGITCLNDIGESHILCLFGDNGALKGENNNYCFRRFLKKIGISPITKNRILSLIPKTKDVERVKDYLSHEEVEAIKSAIRTEGKLSLRERAIAAVLYYTALRATDISNLKLTDIDWVNETIYIVQEKTEVPLELPLDPSYGNYIYRYITEERGYSEESFVFLKKARPYGKVPAPLITSHIMNLVYDAANVRMNPGDRRGTHIFRHHAVSSMLSNNINGAVISASLGHSSRSSLNPYLNSDFRHLKNCALSLEKYPMSRKA